MCCFKQSFKYMGSRSSSGDGDGDGDDICFTADKPHFFKIVVEGKLMFPKKFVMQHGSAMGNRIFLRLPNGKVWEMELSKHGKYAWFQKGWLRFVEHYSLTKGDLLLFQYQGCKEFTVMMIRASWSNINDSRKTRIRNKVLIPGGDDGYAEVVAGLNEGRRDKRKSTLSCPDFRENLHDEERTDDDDDVPLEVSDDFHSSKKMKPNSSKENTSASLSDFKLSRNFHLGETSRRVVHEFDGTSAFARSKKDKVAKRNKKSEIKRIGVSESGNSYFSVVLQPSYVRKGATLTIPSVFDCKQNIILKVADKSWDVIIAKYKTNPSIITRGWSKFAMENSLKVGDCCVFELLKTQANVLKVSIYRKAKRGKPSLPCPSFREMNLDDEERTDDDDDVSVEVTNKSKGNPNTSHFKQTGKFHLGDTSGTSACGRGKKGSIIEMINRPLACPDFCEKNLDDEERTDDDDDVPLEASDDFHSSKKMRPNSSKENTSAPLSDFRQSGKFNLGETSRRVAQEFGGTSAFAKSKKDKVAKRNKESEIKRIGVTKSGNHYFSVVLQPSYVRKGATLGIPINFDCKQNMILKVADKSWDVIITKYVANSCQITRGWSKFAMENSLQVGDFCVFELLKTQADVLKVSICRKANRGNPSLPRPSFREMNIDDEERTDDDVSGEVSNKWKGKPNSAIENTSHFRQTEKFHLGETSGHIAEEVGGTSACGRGKKGGKIEMTNRPSAFEQVGVLESGNHYFNVVLHPSHVHNYKWPKIVVPKEFAVDHIKCPQNMTLKVEDKSWPVLIANHGGSSTIRIGWSQFARANGLQVGDSCVFELLKAESNVLKVLISRHAG